MTVLITGSNGYIGNYFINKYSHKYQFNFFSLLSDKLNNINFN